VQQIVKIYDTAPAKPVMYETTRRSPQMYDKLRLRMVRCPTTHVERSGSHGHDNGDFSECSLRDLLDLARC